MKNQTEFIKKLQDWGFKTNPFNKKITGIQNLIENHKFLETKRSDLDFDIDGIVYVSADMDSYGGSYHFLCFILHTTQPNKYLFCRTVQPMGLMCP